VAPSRARLIAVVALGAAGAAWVGYTTATNPGAPPTLVAVPFRVAIVSALILTGLFAHLPRRRGAMGRLLIGAGFFSCVWLLDASRDETIFRLSWVASVLAPAVLCYLMLAFPSGRIRSAPERSFILASTGLLGLLALAGLAVGPAALTAARGMSGFYVGLPEAHRELAVIVRVAWLIVTSTTAVLVISRAVRANAHFSRLLFPMTLVAVAYASITFGHLVAGAEPSSSMIDALAIAGAMTALAIPLAIFAGLAMERLSLGQVLARFVAALGTDRASNVQRAMASTLNDPQLRIFYRREGSDAFVDADGLPQSPPGPRPSRRQTVVDCEGRSVAVVDFDANLADQEELVHATAKAGVIWLERERLASELAASKSSLEASRVRLAHAADEERQRIQRDLHDGAQQHLIGMHLKLALALEALPDEPARSVALLADVGDEMGETVSDLRALASRVFPPTLSEHGLVDALAAAIRRMGLAVTLEARGIGRHPAEVETQIYFVCLEGLQNIGKHGGPDVAATLRLWEVPRWLYVELRDWGTGFDPETVDGGAGLQNMHDRLESMGGQLRIRSHAGRGTLIRGVVPLRRARPPGRAPAW
jgi:signal transduction histidine kinase